MDRQLLCECMWTFSLLDFFLNKIVPKNQLNLMKHLFGVIQGNPQLENNR